VGGWVLRYACAALTPLQAIMCTLTQEYSHMHQQTTYSKRTFVLYLYIYLDGGCGKTYVFISDVIDEGGVCA
jgi:hypothetical protein